MPEALGEATEWLLQKLSGDLQGAKMWPLKLHALKHQEALRAASAAMYALSSSFEARVWSITLKSLRSLICSSWGTRRTTRRKFA